MRYFQFLRMALPVLVVSLAVYSCSGQGGSANTAGGGCDVKSEVVDVAAFSNGMSQEEDFILLDVRTPQEYAEGHLEGSVNINFFDGDFKDQVNKLDKEKTVYIYCRSGNRSGKGAAVLKELCFTTIKDLQGGIMAWGSAGKQTVK